MTYFQNRGVKIEFEPHQDMIYWFKRVTDGQKTILFGRSRLREESYPQNAWREVVWTVESLTSFNKNLTCLSTDASFCIELDCCNRKGSSTMDHILNGCVSCLRSSCGAVFRVSTLPWVPHGSVLGNPLFIKSVLLVRKEKGKRGHQIKHFSSDIDR